METPARAEAQTQTKPAAWVVPVLVAALAAATLMAMAAWVQIVFGGFLPGVAPVGSGGMMHGGGMMMNTAQPGATGMMSGTHDMGAMMGGNMADTCEEMQSAPQVKAMHDQCEKTMGTDHDNMHQQMPGTAKDKTL